MAAVSFLQADADYRREVGENQSSLKHILKSPGHYKAAKDRWLPPSTNMQIGSALHCLCLEGEDEFHKRYVKKPEGLKLNTKDGKEWVAQQGDKVIFSNNDKDQTWDSIFGMAERLGTLEWFSPDPAIGFDEYRKYNEISIYWDNETYGIPCKARLDRVVGVNPGEQGFVLDLKTTDSVNPKKFERKLHDLGYIFQAAWYTLAAEMAFGKPFRFVFAGVERSSPYTVALFEIDDTMMAEGMTQAEEACKRLKSAMKTKSWDPPDILFHTLTLPEWYVSPVPVDLHDEDLF